MNECKYILPHTNRARRDTVHGTHTTYKYNNISVVFFSFFIHLRGIVDMIIIILFIQTIIHDTHAHTHKHSRVCPGTSEWYRGEHNTQIRSNVASGMNKISTHTYTTKTVFVCAKRVSSTSAAAGSLPRRTWDTREKRYHKYICTQTDTHINTQFANTWNISIRSQNHFAFACKPMVDGISLSRSPQWNRTEIFKFCSWCRCFVDFQRVQPNWVTIKCNWLVTQTINR